MPRHRCGRSSMAKEISIVHHADRRTDVMMPYAPGIVVRRGSLVFLSGVTAAAVYHSHPHREEEFDLPATMEEQAVRAMENLRKTLEAAGCTLGDLVAATRYLTDLGEQGALNRVWARYLGGHLPTTTTVEVSRLATHPRCKLEISAIAVADAEPGGGARHRPRGRVAGRRSARRARVRVARDARGRPALVHDRRRPRDARAGTALPRRDRPHAHARGRGRACEGDEDRDQPGARRADGRVLGGGTARREGRDRARARGGGAAEERPGLTHAEVPRPVRPRHARRGVVRRGDDAERPQARARPRARDRRAALERGDR